MNQLQSQYVSFDSWLVLSLSMAYCWCLDLFFDFLGTPSISIHQCHWVVQIPGREKSSKWKYKDDEGGKKDAEKEKTRSREKESSMHQIINEWRFQNSHYIPLCNYALSFSYFGLLQLYSFRSTSPTTSKTSGEQKDAKASSRDRDEGTSQPNPRWEEVETMRRHHLAFGCFGGVAKVDSFFFKLCFYSITVHIYCVFVSLLDVLRNWEYLVIVNILWCIPRPSLSRTYCWYYASTCLHDFFSIHLNRRCIHLVPPLNCWVVQMPAREKSSKWKYKDDEGGKKDTEKEKTRSREQESRMNHEVPLRVCD